MKLQRIIGILIISSCSLIYSLSIMIAQLTMYSAKIKGEFLINYMDYIPTVVYVFLIIPFCLGLYLIFQGFKLEK